MLESACEETKLGSDSGTTGSGRRTQPISLCSKEKGRFMRPLIHAAVVAANTMKLLQLFLPSWLLQLELEPEPVLVPVVHLEWRHKR